MLADCRWLSFFHRPGRYLSNLGMTLEILKYGVHASHEVGCLIGLNGLGTARPAMQMEIRVMEDSSAIWIDFRPRTSTRDSRLSMS
jgi:hypothetical protein